MEAAGYALLEATRFGAKMAFEAASGGEPINFRKLLQVENAANLALGSTIDVNGTAIEVVQCQPYVYDCSYLQAQDNPFTSEDNINATCANYTYQFKYPDTLGWLLAASAVFAMAMAYGIGANDSANSWGTSVGSGALPLLPAVLTGGIMDWLGAILLGYGVSGTIRKGVASPDDPSCWGCGRCNTKMTLYMTAMFCALFAASIFLLLCSFTAMPVSTTHAIIGGVVGATVVGNVDWGCLNWSMDGGLGGIVISWVASPVGSGVIAAVWYLSIDRIVFRSANPMKAVRWVTPLLYGVTVFFIVMLITLKSKPLSPLPMWGKMTASVVLGVLSAAIDFFFMTPWVKKRLPSIVNPESASPAAVPEEAGPIKADGEAVSSGDVKASMPAEKEEPEDNEPLTGIAYWKRTCLTTVDGEMADELAQAASGTDAMHVQEDMTPDQRDANSFFKYMLVFVAALESFAHGANDTANATGAFSAVYLTYTNGQDDCADAGTPVWVMAVAGFCVFLGVTTLGWRVIMTIGFSLTQMNFMRGYCVEFASTVTVVIFTVLNIPVSTTHCQVGAVCAAGMVSFGARNVKWSLFGRIVMTWILTLPFSALLAGGMLGMMAPAVINYYEFKTSILSPEDFLPCGPGP
mmetsp:Transcript_31793/g.90301  ORF Transcript_31793/g.90301 Transcript_31793/m.90301 type:complete len:633 (+) Transcript_31793:106-2004(+)|eukprot:CAMPEP_0117662756 /NCGR_PEP_ID=MMETSP0804-20121206/8219_1 /TAXON_ID=1074897 /ORGANISM="Tetraselmis astigmatica, Strain CCMP880" /LENGTH=632 /DNA_ID=CAMNT_0005469669 /DNA_START=81 /DNA_END=1982 /DNA_ORIENTATION=+